MHPQSILNAIEMTNRHPALIDLYGDRTGQMAVQSDRYTALVRRFSEVFPNDADVFLFSSPGRTEVGGNHTDHNAGRVLAAAVNLDILAAVSPSADGKIVIDSEGYRRVIVDLGRLEVVEQEKNTTNALARGVAARMKALGYAINGFHACLTSTVPNGSGLSSSAAFEIMMVTILSELYNQGSVPPVQAALIGQYAENVFFGKPCGLMDQTTCAVGGFVTIDFKDFSNPVVHKVDYDFNTSGYSLAIIGTGGSHADLTGDYAAIEGEMKAVAHVLGGNVLREFSSELVLDRMAALRGKVSDRGILRALHFFADDARVVKQVDALEKGAFDRFLQLVTESGNSSWMLCQNVFSTQNVHEQGLAVALIIAESILSGQGAWRVHGGGFAGTIQAFVPEDLVPPFFGKMAEIFGEANCHLISIRAKGATKVDLT